VEEKSEASAERDGRSTASTSIVVGIAAMEETQQQVQRRKLKTEERVEI
jgi:hypothetical protein